MANNFLDLAHICIYKENLEKSVIFYTENLHFEKSYQTQDENENGLINYAVVKLNNCILELVEDVNKDGFQPGNEGSIDHFSIEVKNLSGIVKDLKNKDVVFTTDVFTF